MIKEEGQRLCSYYYLNLNLTKVYTSCKPSYPGLFFMCPKHSFFFVVGVVAMVCNSARLVTVIQTNVNLWLDRGQSSRGTVGSELTSYSFPSRRSRSTIVCVVHSIDIASNKGCHIAKLNELSMTNSVFSCACTDKHEHAIIIMWESIRLSQTRMLSMSEIYPTDIPTDIKVCPPTWTLISVGSLHMPG